MKGWQDFQGSVDEYLNTIPREQWSDIDTTRETFLMFAVRRRDVKAIKKLLTLGFDYVNNVNCNGHTALHIVCIHGNEELISIFCASNADFSIQFPGAKKSLIEWCIGNNGNGKIDVVMELMLCGVRLPKNCSDSKLCKLERLLLKHRSVVCAFLIVAKKRRDYRWDRFLLYALARQVWELRFLCFDGRA